MTMRSSAYFACENGHRGIERTSENDQPYSKMWESISLEGMREVKDLNGKVSYCCTECGSLMRHAQRPEGAA